MRPNIDWIRWKIWKGVFAGQALQFEPTIEFFICSIDIDNTFEKLLFSRMHDRNLTDFCLDYQKVHLQIQRLRSSATSTLCAFSFLRYRLSSENLFFTHARPEVDRKRSKIWKCQLKGLELSFETNVESLDQSVLKLQNYGRTDWHTEWLTDGQTDTPNL